MAPSQGIANDERFAGLWRVAPEVDESERGGDGGDRAEGEESEVEFEPLVRGRIEGVERRRSGGGDALVVVLVGRANGEEREGRLGGGDEAEEGG